MDNRFRSRKFLLAVAFTTTGVVGLFADKIGGGEFIGLAGVVLGLYGTASVVEAKS
jgi:hypothetical protein